VRNHLWQYRSFVLWQYIPSWWLQPIWKIFVRLDHFPEWGWKFQKYLKPPPRLITYKRWDEFIPNIRSLEPRTVGIKDHIIQNSILEGPLMTSTRCVRENSGRLRGNNFLQTQMIPHDWQLIGQKRDNKKNRYSLKFQYLIYLEPGVDGYLIYRQLGA